MRLRQQGSLTPSHAIRSLTRTGCAHFSREAPRRGSAALRCFFHAQDTARPLHALAVCLRQKISKTKFQAAKALRFKPRRKTRHGKNNSTSRLFLRRNCLPRRRNVRSLPRGIRRLVGSRTASASALRGPHPGPRAPALRTMRHQLESVAVRAAAPGEGRRKRLHRP